MEILILVVLVLPLVFPFLLARTVLQWTANSFADPRTPEAARAVRKVARICVALTLIPGVAFSGWCYAQSENYRPGPGIDLGGLLYYAGCFVPILPMALVLIGVAIPVRVSFWPGNESGSGFSRSR